MADLAARGVRALCLVLLVGSAGLQAVVVTTWLGVPIQRCAVHKLRNVLAHGPQHCHDALHADYEPVVHAPDEPSARAGHAAFVRKWSKRCAPRREPPGGRRVAPHPFPLPGSTAEVVVQHERHKRLHGEFRRWVKTQGALPAPEAVVLLLFGLLVSGQVCFRPTDGCRAMPQVVSPPLAAAA